ncbi:MAG: hypothetical protein ACFCU6_05750 [Balneolaceae bacterium]
MNQIFKYLSIFILVFCMLPIFSVAQNGDPVYVQIDFMNVKPGEGGQYVQVEQEIWKPIHEERINRGIISYWGLYGAMYTEPGANYNYITVNVFDDLKKLENFYDMNMIDAVHPDVQLQSIMERTNESRELVHSEVWQLIDSEFTEDESEDIMYLVVNDFQVQPGGGGEYLTVEQEFWKPIHEYRIENGMMAGWHLYSLMVPAGSAVPYNYKTVDFYKSLGDLGQPLTQEILSSANPELSGTGLEAFFERTQNARSVYRSVLMERIDYAATPEN